MNNPLKYSNCWEDAELLGNALHIDESSDVLSVASAGDNSLYLLKFSPKTMTCIDLNEVQLFVTELKAQSIKYLNYIDFLKFLGFEQANNRIELYMKLKPFLSPNCTDYFNNNLKIIQLGIINQGKFEKYFQKFATLLLPLIHTKKDVEALFKEKTNTAQEIYYYQKWNNTRWKLLFKLFFSKWVMGKFGREPEKLKHVKGKVSELIYQKAEKHLTSTTCQHNYILEYALKGSFINEKPPFATEDCFNQIKTWLIKNDITYLKSSLDESLKTHTTYNRFNLSNIFEYMSEIDFLKNMKAIEHASATNSRICYWNLMVPRKLKDSTIFTEETNFGSDKGFFYQEFITYSKI